MKNLLIASALALGLLASPVMATEPVSSDPSVVPTAPTVPVITDDEGLFEAFGGREGITRVVDVAMARWLQNPRTRSFFESSDQTRIKAQLVEQFCVIMNGPCTYSGRSMAESHRGMNVSEGSFYALVEELQIALNQENIPFRAQNRLLAALAPMHRDIINR